MKRQRNVWSILITSALILCILFVAYYVLYSSERNRALWFTRNTSVDEEMLYQIKNGIYPMQVFSDGHYHMNTADEVPEYLRQMQTYDLISVEKVDEDLLRFRFTWHTEPESSIWLDYYMGSDYDVLYYTGQSKPSGQIWYLDQQDESKEVFMGGGANGKGHIIVEHIETSWYLVDMYIPT